MVLCEVGNCGWLSSDGVRLSYSDVEEWKGFNDRELSLWIVVNVSENELLLIL